MIQTLSEAQAYLESFIRPTVFERIKIDSKLYDPLDRMRVLLDLLGNPHDNFKSIQVTGTSGKGSTAYLTANLLTKAGYKTGLTVSPHLQSLNERVQINMETVSDEVIVSLVNTVQKAAQQMKTMPVGDPSYFELLLAIAFYYFSQEKIDIAVVEVGLEGRWDATNVLDPIAVILTTISKDHTEILGETEEAIAREATSIIRKGKKNTPIVVSGVNQPQLQALIKEKTVKAASKLFLLNEDMQYQIQSQRATETLFDYQDTHGELKNLSLSLLGEHQVQNASVALAAVRSLSNQGFSVSEDAIRAGLQQAFFAGRFERISFKEKEFILDGAHNEEKMQSLLSSLKQYYPKENILFILGFKKRRDINSMISLLMECHASYIVTAFHKTADYAISVSMNLEELKEAFADYSDKIIFKATAPEALDEAEKHSNKVVVVTGSLYLVGEMRDYLTEK